MSLQRLHLQSACFAHSPPPLPNMGFEAKFKPAKNSQFSFLVWHSAASLTFGKSRNLFSVTKLGQHFPSDCRYKQQIRKRFVYAAPIMEVMYYTTMHQKSTFRDRLTFVPSTCKSSSCQNLLSRPEPTKRAIAPSSVHAPRDSRSVSYMCQQSALSFSGIHCFLDISPNREHSSLLQYALLAHLSRRLTGELIG